MPKSGSFSYVLGGGIGANGIVSAVVTVSKDGKEWVKSTTEFLQMTAEEFAKFKATSDAFAKGKKNTNLNIHELLKMYREGANFLIDLGEKAAK